MSEDKPIVLGRQELEPSELANYQNKIREAKGGNLGALKGSTPLGHVPKQTNTPVFAKTSTQQPASPLNETGGVQPRPPGSPLLSPQTQQQLQELAGAQAKQEDQLEKDVKADLDENKDDLFDMLNFNRLNESERILNNKTRRKEIEGRCIPMRLEDLIMKDEVTQIVPIVPEKFVVKFRSATPAESLFVKRLIADEKTTADQYIMEKYSIFQLTCSLVSINGSDLPNHMNEKGEPSEDLFMKKLKMVLKKSLYVVADLGINFYWFDLRVRRLLNPDDLKNG